MAKQPSKKETLLFSLLKVMFLVLAAITAFEYAKYIIFPWLTVFYSHLIGITFGVLIVGFTAYRVQKKQEKLLVEKIDETEMRMQSEESLRSAEEKYRTLFIESMDGVCQTTLEGTIVEANQAFCNILGADADGIVGESIAQYYDNPEDRIKFRSMVEKNKGVKNYEIIQKRKDGEQIICSVSSSCCYSNKGELSGYLSIVRDITKEKKAERQIEHLAFHDSLTGLANRRNLEERLFQILARADRHREKFALLIIDLNRFKEVNDTFGHAQGDKILQEAAEKLNVKIRQEDIVARLGGDEFAVLLSETKGSDDIQAVIERINENFKSLQCGSITLSASIGFAIYPDDGATLDMIFMKADDRMYKEKEKLRKIS
jgi:diguanylate cyclase (GGDEF)-like protein/PAS domain S-box-containing protein